MYFLKIHRNQQIINCEKLGLERIGNHISIPRLIYHGVIDTAGFLILGYIQQMPIQKFSSSKIAESLVKLHTVESRYYGLEYNNYIGQLNQPNTKASNFLDFYVQQRIEPQVILAQTKGFLEEINLSSFYKYVAKQIPIEKPRLIHGDLWNGNLICSETELYFIDPSISYSHREFDLAMMQLFGGFNKEVFSIYNELMPLEQGWKQRQSLFQLYYLLVHLNIFGSSYLKSCLEILKKN